MLVPFLPSESANRQAMKAKKASREGTSGRQRMQALKATKPGLEGKEGRP